MPDKHILAPQRKAREASITNNDIRASIGLLPLKARVKSTSSPMSSSSTKSSKVSPALQSSQSSQSSKKKQTPPKTTTKTSPNTTTKREKPLLLQLDPDLLNEIYKKSVFQDSYVLRKWIDIKKIRLTEFCSNPNATSFLYKMFKANPNTNIRWDMVSSNPSSIELLRERIAYEKTKDISNVSMYNKINWNNLSENPNAIELLEQKIKEEKAMDPYILSNLQPYQKIDWTLLSKNPNAIELLKTNINNIKISTLLLYNKNIDEELIIRILEEKPETLENLDYLIWTIPKAIRLLTRMIPDKDRYPWNYISKNTSYKAITLLKAKALEENTLIEHNPTAYKLLTRSSKNVINWNYLSGNPKAIELLTIKALKEKTLRDTNPKEYYHTTRIGLLCWVNLSSNPKAIRLLEDKALEERTLRDTNPNTYKTLPDDLKIHWDLVTDISLLETKAIEEKQLRYTNFKAYEELLHTDRINWKIVSSNPKAISLLETKAIEEKEMRQADPEKYKSLKEYCKINWNRLSANPKAIKLLETYPEYISFKGLCENPNAVKLIRENIDNFKTARWQILSSNPCIFYETSN
jgi:hypothetical protein